jgi:hypothetical protein
MSNSLIMPLLAAPHAASNNPNKKATLRPSQCPRLRATSQSALRSRVNPQERGFASRSAPAARATPQHRRAARHSRPQTASASASSFLILVRIGFRPRLGVWGITDKKGAFAGNANPFPTPPPTHTHTHRPALPYSAIMVAPAPRVCVGCGLQSRPRPS